MKKIEWTRQTPPPVQILKTKALSNVLSLSFTEQQPSVIQEEVSEGFYRLIALPAKTILQHSREVFKENILTKKTFFYKLNAKSSRKMKLSG